MIGIMNIFNMFIDRLIALMKRREEVNKIILDQFIEPVIKDFETLHREYIARFTKYRELVEDTKIPLNRKHPVMALMKKDTLYSKATETKIQQLEHIKIRNNSASAFLETVRGYLFSSIEEPCFYDPFDIDLKIMNLGGIPRARTRHLPAGINQFLGEDSLNDEGRRKLILVLIDR